MGQGVQGSFLDATLVEVLRSRNQVWTKQRGVSTRSVGPNQSLLRLQDAIIRPSGLGVEFEYWRWNQGLSCARQVLFCVLTMGALKNLTVYQDIIRKIFPS